jgi:hypothetical protein
MTTLTCKPDSARQLPLPVGELVVEFADGRQRAGFAVPSQFPSNHSISWRARGSVAWKLQKFRKSSVD